MNYSTTAADSNASKASSNTLVPTLTSKTTASQRVGTASSTIHSSLRSSTVTSNVGKKRKKAFHIPNISFGTIVVPPLRSSRECLCYSSSEELTNPSKFPIPEETLDRLAFLGYKQELHRNWDFWSLLSMSFCNVSIMPSSVTCLAVAHEFYGPITLTLGAPVAWFFLVCMSACLAEMASAYPVAGAMFTWTFKLLRANPHLRDWARLISWVTGFCLFVAYALLQVHIASEFSLIFTTVILASGVTWNVTPQHLGAIGLVYILASGLVSLAPYARSPSAWKIMGVGTIILNAASIIVLFTTSSPQAKVSSLLTMRTPKFGFPSKAYTLLRAWSMSTVQLISEPAVHMAEEAKNPAQSIPRALFCNTLLSGFWQMLCSICLIMTVPPMKHAAAPGWAVINAIFWHCPKPAAQFVTISLLICHFISNVAQVLGTSRFFWALARDKALPFAKFLRQVTPDRRPVRASCLLMLSAILAGIVCLEPTGVVVTIARLTIFLLTDIAYLVPLLAYLLAEKGVYDRDGRNVWALRGFSKPLAFLSTCFLVVSLIIYGGPSKWPVTKNTFPWALVAVPGIMLISLVFWFIYGKSHFVGPVKSLTTWTVGYEVELPKKVTRLAAQQDQLRTVDATRTQFGTANQRSEANLTNQRDHTFGIPQTYHTYGSNGSLWTETADEAKD